MAKLTYIGTPLVNKRNGIVYYPSGLKQIARANGISLQPLSNIQSISQVNFAAGAQVWSTMTLTQQNAWLPFVPAGSNTYATFMSWAQNLSTWGVPALYWPDPPAPQGTWPQLGIAYLMVVAGRCIYTFYCDAAFTQVSNYYAQLYLDPAGVIAAWGPGLSGGSAVNAPPPGTPVYCGYIGPMKAGYYCQCDVTDVVNEVMGQFGQDWSIHWPTALMEGGSGFAASLAFTDYAGQVLGVPFQDTDFYWPYPYGNAWNWNPGADPMLPLVQCTLTRKPQVGNPPAMPAF